MRSVSIWVISIVCVLTSSIYFEPSTAVLPDGDITIQIPGESQRYVLGKSSLVAGVWHYVNVSLDKPAQRIEIKMYKGNEEPNAGERNRSNYYSWAYENNDWRDDQYNTFIDRANCSNSPNYAFCIGVQSDADYGNWTMELIVDGDKIAVKEVYVEVPVTSIELRCPDFKLLCEPFTETEINSGVDRFTVANDAPVPSERGNIPLSLSISYDKYGERFNVTLPSILHISEKTSSTISLTSASWRPKEISILCTIRASSLYLIPSGMLSFITEYEQRFQVTISVRHIGYDLYEIPEREDTTFQYQKELKADYNETLALKTYLCGDVNATFNVTVINATLLNVENKDGASELPFFIQSNSTDEYMITTNVLTNTPDTVAYVTYLLDFNGSLQQFTTSVAIGPAPPREAPNAIQSASEKLSSIIVIAGIIGIIIYIVASQAHASMRRKRKK